MLSSNQLLKNESMSNAAILKMEAELARLNVEIAKAEADKSRSRDWVLETVKAARAKAMPVLNAEMKSIQALAKTSSEHEPFWQSKPLVLSLQKFDEDAAKNAQIRMAYAGEFSRLPLPLLLLTLQNATADKNMPLVYQCWAAGMARQGEAGFTGTGDLSLDSIELPEQAAALSAIGTCKVNADDAERIFFVANGQADDPIRRMNIGRARQAATRFVAASASV